MQINRLFGIVYFLMNRKNSTAKELSERFEVSARTILRDINSLSEAGIPIYTTQGKGGGIYIMDNFVLNRTIISEEEQNQILFALQGLSATQNINTEKILNRLRSFFEKSDTNWIEIDFSRWGSTTEDKIKFEILKNSVISKKIIAFTYFSSYGGTCDRKVSPLKLVFKSKSWYLQAYCLQKEDYRTFKISRMKNIEMLDEMFPDIEFQIPKIEADEYQAHQLADVKLQFSSSLAYRIYDDFAEDNITKNTDGSFIVSAKFPMDYWLYGYILSFGDLVTVLSPQSLKKEILDIAEKIKLKYKI